MRVVGAVLGVAVGLFTASMLVVPVIELVMGDCFWEQGCEPHHNLKFLASLSASAFGGVFAGWGVARLFNKLVSKVRQP